jgi:hypothetical protein
MLVMRLHLPTSEKKVGLQITGKGELCHCDPSVNGIMGKAPIEDLQTAHCPGPVPHFPTTHRYQ